MNKIIELNSENVKAVAEIDAKCFCGEKWSEKLFKEEIGKEGKIYGVFYVNDIPVGFGGLEQIFDEGNILNLAVLPEYRKQGIATEILDYLIDKGIKKGIKSFTLEVRESNDSARRIYEKKGFVNVGKRKCFYPDKEDACIYWLYLQGE